MIKYVNNWYYWNRVAHSVLRVSARPLSAVLRRAPSRRLKRQRGFQKQWTRNGSIRPTNYRYYLKQKLGFCGTHVQRIHVPKTLCTGWGSSLTLTEAMLRWLNRDILPATWRWVEYPWRKQQWHYLQLIKYYERAGYACNHRLERRLTTAFFNWRNKLIDSQRWYRHANPHIQNYKHTIAVLHDKYVWPRKNYQKSLTPLYTSKIQTKYNQHASYTRGTKKSFPHDKADWFVTPGGTQAFGHHLNFYHLKKRRRTQRVPALDPGYWLIAFQWAYARQKQRWKLARPGRRYPRRDNAHIRSQLAYLRFRYQRYTQLRSRVATYLKQKEELRVQGLVYGQLPYRAVQKTRKWADFVSEYKQGLFQLGQNAQQVWYRPVDWSKPAPWVSHWNVLDEIFKQYADESFELAKQKQRSFLRKRSKWTPIWQFMARGYRVGDIAHRWPSEYPKRSYFYRPIWRRPFAFIEYREWKRHVYYHRHVWTRFMRTKKYDWKTKYGGVFLRRWNYEYGLYQGQVLLMDQFTGIPAHDVLLDQKLWGAQTAKAGFKTVGSKSTSSWRWAHPRDAWFSGRQQVPGYFGHLCFHKTFFQTFGWETYAKRTATYRSVQRQAPGHRWVLAKYEKAYRDKLGSLPTYLSLEQCLQLKTNQTEKFRDFCQTENLAHVRTTQSGVAIPFTNGERGIRFISPAEHQRLKWFSLNATALYSESQSWQLGTYGAQLFMALGAETLYLYNTNTKQFSYYFLGDRSELPANRWFAEYHAKRFKTLTRLHLPTQDSLRLREQTQRQHQTVNWQRQPQPLCVDPTHKSLPNVNHHLKLDTTLFFGSPTLLYTQLLKWDTYGQTPLSNVEHRCPPRDDPQLYNQYNTRLPVNWQTLLTHTDSLHYGEFVPHPTRVNYGSWAENRVTTARATYWNSATDLQRLFVLTGLVGHAYPFYFSSLYVLREKWVSFWVPKPFEDPHWQSPILWQKKHFPATYDWKHYLDTQRKFRLLNNLPGHVKRILTLYPIYGPNCFPTPQGMYQVCTFPVRLAPWYVRPDVPHVRRQKYEIALDFGRYPIHFCARNIILYPMWCYRRLPSYRTPTKIQDLPPPRHKICWTKWFLHLRNYEIPALLDEDLPPWVPWGIIFYSGSIKNWIIVGQETMQPGWICLKSNAFLEFGIQHGLIYSGTYGRHYAPMVYAGFTHGFVVGITALRSPRARFWADYEIHLVYIKFHRKYSQHFRSQFFETDMPETGSWGCAKRFNAWHSWIPLFGSRVRYWNFLAQCMDQGDWEPSCVWGRTRAHYDLIRWKLVDSATHGGYGIEIPQYSYRFDSAKRERDFFDEKLVFGNWNSRGLILYKDIKKVVPRWTIGTHLRLHRFDTGKVLSTQRVGFSGYWIRNYRYYRWIQHQKEILELRRTTTSWYKQPLADPRTPLPRWKLKKTKMRLQHRFRHLEPVDFARAKKIFKKCLDSPKVWAGIEMRFSYWFNESLFDYQIDRVVERLKPFVERQRDPTRGMYEFNPHWWMCHNGGRATLEFSNKKYWKEEVSQAIRLVLFLHVAEGYRKLYSETTKKAFPHEHLASADAHVFGRAAINSSAMWIGLLLHESSGIGIVRVHEAEWYWRRKHFIGVLGRHVYGKEPRIHKGEFTGLSDWEFLFENFDRWYKRDLDWKRDQEYRRINHGFPFQHVHHYKQTLRKKVNKWG